MNEVILGKNNLVTNAAGILTLAPTNTHEEGALDTKTKEMPGLVVRQQADASLR